MIKLFRPVFILSFLFVGCTGVGFRAGDALKEIYSGRVAELRSKYGSGRLDAEIEIARASGSSRNVLLNDFIFLIDNNYSFYEKHLYDKKAYSDFGTDVTSATLSTLSGIVTGGGAQGAKSILSFVAGGITSTRASFNQNILQNQNLLAIVAKMRALRAEKLIALQKGMYVARTTTPSSITAYSVDQGLVDLATYYQAGTFVAALQDIIDKAGKAKSDSEKTVSELKGIPD